MGEEKMLHFLARMALKLKFLLQLRKAPFKKELMVGGNNSLSIYQTKSAALNKRWT